MSIGLDVDLDLVALLWDTSTGPCNGSIVSSAQIHLRAWVSASYPEKQRNCFSIDTFQQCKYFLV